MHKPGLVYRSIFIYRLAMIILYLGTYKKRFQKITNLIDNNDKSVVELCFGDTYIAQYCRSKSINWTGIDINKYFVNRAKKLKYNAHEKDILNIDQLPKADVCIIVCSLYHFINDIDNVFDKMICCSKKIIIAEPIKNLSSRKDIIGKVSAYMTNAGKGKESFRFNEQSFLDLIEKYKAKYNFNYVIVEKAKEIIIKIY